MQIYIYKRVSAQSSVLNYKGVGCLIRWVVGSQHKFLKVVGHNKVTFRARYNFIGKIRGNWYSNFEYRTG